MATIRVFSTMDLYLSAFLSLNNMEPAMEINGGKVVFTFNTTDELYRLLNLFNSDEAVGVASFTTKVKILRGKMLSMRNQGNEKERGYERHPQR